MLPFHTPSSSSRRPPSPHTARRNWSILSSSKPVAPLSSSRGGVSFGPSSTNTASAATASSEGVERGESVVVILSDSAVDSLCCGLVGNGGRICFRSRSSCPVLSHTKNRVPVKPGIYIISSDDDYVFRNPVGPVELYHKFPEDILRSSEASAAEWAQRFNVLRRAMDVKVDPDVLVNVKAKARAQQTPARPQRSSATPMALLTLPTEKEIALFQQISSIYEKVWRYDPTTGSKIPAPVLPDEFFIQETLASQLAGLSQTQEALRTLVVEKNGDRDWMAEQLDVTNLRVTDLETSVGLPGYATKELHPDLWSSVSHIAGEVSNLDTNLVQTRASMNEMERGLDRVSAQTRDHEDELEKMFSTTTNAFNDVQRSLTNLHTRVDNVSPDVVGLSAGVMQVSSSQVEDLVRAVNALRADREQDRARIELLESQLESGSTKLELGNSTILRSSLDVQTLLQSFGAEAIDFGGFVCPYIVFIRLHRYIEGDGSFQEVFKNKKDLKGMNISEDEAISIFSHSSVLPPIFGGNKTSKSEIGTLPSYEKWREKKTQSGLAFEIEKFLPLVQSDVTSIIRVQYRNQATLSALADRLLLKAIDFVNQFVRWVDDTYLLLQAGGNPKEDCWWIVSRVCRAIFADYLYPARLTPHRTSFASKGHQAGLMIWGAIRCFLASDAMLEKGFRDHPIVVGAYAQWLVSNSGRKEAQDAQKAVDKLNKEVSSVTTSAKELKSSVAELQGKVKAAKATADKALARQAS